MDLAKIAEADYQWRLTLPDDSDEGVANATPEQLAEYDKILASLSQ